MQDRKQRGEIVLQALNSSKDHNAREREREREDITIAISKDKCGLIIQHLSYD